MTCANPDCGHPKHWHSKAGCAMISDELDDDGCPCTEFREQPSEQEEAMDDLEQEAKAFLEDKGYIGANENEKARLMAPFARLKVEQREKQIIETCKANMMTTYSGDELEPYNAGFNEGLEFAINEINGSK